MPASMMALVACLVTWIVAQGAEYGVVFCLLGLIASANVCIAYNSRRQPPKRAVRRNIDWTYDRGSSPELVAELVVVAILAPLASAGMLIALVHLLPWTMASKMALAALCFPLLWAALSLIYRLLDRSRHYAAALSVLAAATLSIYYGV